MEFKQLEAFVAVVDYGSFSEAARRLYLTQPTISAHIRSLEDELHMKLIIRTTKKTGEYLSDMFQGFYGHLVHSEGQLLS